MSDDTIIIIIINYENQTQTLLIYYVMFVSDFHNLSEALKLSKHACTTVTVNSCNHVQPQENDFGDERRRVFNN